MQLGELILIILSIVLIFLIWIAWSAIFGAPWVPTPSSKVAKMLELATVRHDDVLYDLGSGDGRIVIMAADKFHAQSVGIEIDPLRVLWSRLVIRRMGLRKKVKIIRGNFFKMSLQKATVVTLYQTVKVNERLKEKLQQELNPGTRVVSHSFQFQDWDLADIDEKASNYLYIV